MLTRVPRDWPHRRHSRSVASGALDWHVQVAGKGPTVLLLHGTGSSAHTWADVLPHLTARATVVAPDLPGQGFTLGATRGTLGMPAIATALEAMLDALGLPPVSLAVGHSAGAAVAIAWAFASANPPRGILGFTPSIVPPPWLYTAFLAPVLTPIATARATTAFLANLGTRSGLVASLLASTRSEIPAVQRDRYGALFRDLAHVRGTVDFMAETDLDALVARGAPPSTRLAFVLGDRDEWVRKGPAQAVIRRTYPSASLALWHGGHLLHEAEPARAADLVLAQLDGLPDPRDAGAHS